MSFLDILFHQSSKVGIDFEYSFEYEPVSSSTFEGALGYLWPLPTESHSLHSDAKDKAHHDFYNWHRQRKFEGALDS